MNTSSLIRTRKQVDTSTLDMIRDRVLDVVSLYKSNHAGFIEGLKHSPAIEALDKLAEDIQSLMQNSRFDSFQKFVKILEKIYSNFELLDNEKEFDLVRQLQTVLAGQLELQAEADWENLMSKYLDGRINDGIRKLDEAQHENEQDVEENSVWTYLNNNFTEKLDEGYATTLVCELMSQFGLPQISSFGDNQSKNNLTGYLGKIIAAADREVLEREEKVEKNKDIAQISRLRDLVNRAKSCISLNISEKTELVAAIKNNVFNSSIKQQVEVLDEQLKIWTTENLIALCEGYLKYYALKWHGNEVHTKSYNAPWRILAENFICPVLNNLIHPLKNICGHQTQDVEVSSLASDFKGRYIAILEEINEEPQSDKKEIMVELKQSLDFYQPESLQSAQQALKLVFENELFDEEKFIANPSLVSALSAAYLYYSTANGITHNNHGKQAALGFIKNLWLMSDPTLRNIQDEAIRFIKGEGKVYGAWYGGASSHHKHSRIAFILDSGLLDDRRGEIFPYQTSSKSRFFDHSISFTEIRDASDREELKERVMSLPTSVLK